MKTSELSGTTQLTERAYEIEGKIIARKAAAEGFVLLKNENEILPISKEEKIALYGSGAVKTVKGGTGSGDVNERKTVSIYEGLINAGYKITTEKWLNQYMKEYEEKRAAWRNQIWNQIDLQHSKADMDVFTIYANTKFQIPSGNPPEKTNAETAVYIISRVSGEGADRGNTEGDYYLSKEEENFIHSICALYKKVVIVLNTGGIIDLSFMEKYENIYGLIYILQPGMEAGNAFADVLSGKTVPSGKLTDTWAVRYEDYPNSSSFSYLDGNSLIEKYEEGIYVGYRYFDSFQIPVRYCFGYGLSYTDFSIKFVSIEKNVPKQDQCKFKLVVDVKNIGEKHCGKEVVQIYASCPQNKMEKEYRRLIGFQKTKLLQPGEVQRIIIEISVDYLTSFNNQIPGWELEAGCYGIFIGDNIANSSFSASVEVASNILLKETGHICSLQEQLSEITVSKTQIEQNRKTWIQKIGDMPNITILEKDVVCKKYDLQSDFKEEPGYIKDTISKLSEKQLIQLVMGEISEKGKCNLGSAGITVPGSAAQTSMCAQEYGIQSVVLADGPAGLRLNPKYQVKNDEILPTSLEASLEHGYLCRDKKVEGSQNRYQFCTAIPVGTLLAQTWNPKLLEKVGKAISKEMELFHVTLWLAPGMNIHRNPLCGRNFEYYSEDPYLTGMMAAAMTKGVQSNKHCGTTVKHFACNNQEDNRMKSNSILSERTLREIYLKGFEIAVDSSQPLAIMTSYNKINGIYAANNYDLCTTLARNEWDFQGIIMTDWTTTHDALDCTASGCMKAGNDLIMPGIKKDQDNIKDSIEAKELDVRYLQRSVAQLLKLLNKVKQ